MLKLSERQIRNRTTVAESRRARSRSPGDPRSSYGAATTQYSRHAPPHPLGARGDFTRAESANVRRAGRPVAADMWDRAAARRRAIRDGPAAVRSPAMRDGEAGRFERGRSRENSRRCRRPGEECARRVASRPGVRGGGGGPRTAVLVVARIHDAPRSASLSRRGRLRERMVPQDTLFCVAATEASRDHPKNLAMPAGSILEPRAGVATSQTRRALWNRAARVDHDYGYEAGDRRHLTAVRRA